MKKFNLTDDLKISTKNNILQIYKDDYCVELIFDSSPTEFFEENGEVLHSLRLEVLYKCKLIIEEIKYFYSNNEE